MRVKTVEVISPPIMVKARGDQRSEPSPLSRAMGRRARTVVPDVIKMGLSRLSPP